MNVVLAGNLTREVWNAEGELKRSRVVPGRIGLSLLVRIALDMLDEAPTIATSFLRELPASPPARNSERRP